MVTIEDGGSTIFQSLVLFQQNTLHHIPGRYNLHPQRRENLKHQKWNSIFEYV